MEERANLKLTLVTPHKKVHEDISVDEIRLPAEEGHATIFADHAEMVSTLDIGILSYRKTGETEFKHSAISWGYCEVNKGKVKLLADDVVLKDQVDIEKEKQEEAVLKKELASNTLPPEEIIDKQDELRFVEAKIKLFNI